MPEKGKTFAGEVREETVAWSKDTYQLLKQAEQGKVKSYVQDIALAVLDCKETATSRETFIRLMNERGYGVDWQDSHKYITYTDLAREQAGEKACKSGITSWKNTTIWILERRVWSMSLREMHEQQKQSSPREQLQELNRQSRTELENSLLKEALAMSSENCEELMKQSNQEQFSRMKNLFSNVLIAREKIERFFMRSSLEKVIKNYNENFSNKRDNDFAQGLIKYLYENAIIGENDKFFLEKNFQYIRIINEKEKRLINVYFCEKPIIDFFQNAEYEKELQYYGINEKDFIKTDI